MGYKLFNPNHTSSLYTKGIMMLKSTRTIFKSTLVLALLATMSSCGEAESQLNVWNVSNPEWGQSAEDEFSDFVNAIGQGRADGSVLGWETVFNLPLLTRIFPRKIETVIFADCADLPMILRAYFAYKQKGHLVGLVQ